VVNDLDGIAPGGKPVLLVAYHEEGDKVRVLPLVLFVVGGIPLDIISYRLDNSLLIEKIQVAAVVFPDEIRRGSRGEHGVHGVAGSGARDGHIGYPHRRVLVHPPSPAVIRIVPFGRGYSPPVQNRNGNLIDPTRRGGPVLIPTSENKGCRKQKHN